MDYQRWMEDGKRALVKRALQEVVDHGLSAPHHFYITFRTQFPGVRIPSEMYESYPEEMTIVINDAFWDLSVTDDHFALDLMFDDKRKHLEIPWIALVHFMDPSVELVLQFDWEGAMPRTSASNVLFIENFRKKS